MTGDCEQKYRFPSPILKVQFNPRNDKVFLVCPMRHSSRFSQFRGRSSSCTLG
uniref:Uncharacterized protein n=1 Tax=Timema poppense TaxID=170557 RepID=A0A7R9DVP6_TIMPO|nr:unnamed protein product [Timema poppensis]